MNRTSTRRCVVALCLLVPGFLALGCALRDQSERSALREPTKLREPDKPSKPDKTSKPNIVFILADDMGYGDVHALNPASRIPTPNLDRLAAEGMMFTDAHTPSAVCTPTRYGVLTGRYCWRGWLKRGVINGYGKRVIEKGRKTVADLLAAAGYHTGIVGKWHLGLAWPSGGEKPNADNIDFAAPIGDVPNELGFAHSYIIPASLDFPPYVYIRDGRVTEPQTVMQPKQAFPAFLRRGPRAKDFVMEESLDHLTKQAVRYIRERGAAATKQPFFLYFPLTAPHKPALPHPRFRKKTKLGDYGDFVAQVDWTVGQVLAALDESRVADDTLVIYTSDNGSYMYRYDQADKEDHTDNPKVQGYRAANHRANGVFRGTKADIWEAGHRVPFFVRWPGEVAKGSRCDATICLTDLMATCAEVVGEKLTGAMGEDSFSFLPHTRGGRPAEPRPPVIHHSSNGMFAIRAGEWKLVAGNGSGGRQRPRGKPFARPYGLFDLAEDIAESNNLIERHPDVAVRLEKALAKIRESGRSGG